MGKTLKKTAAFALPIVGNAIAPGIGGVIGGALGGAINGGGLRGAAIGGLTSLAGNVIGNEFSGAIGSGIGSKVAGSTLADLTGGAASALGDSIGSTTVGSALSGLAGNAVAGDLTSSLFPNKTSQTSTSPNSLLPAPYTPTQSPQLQLPGSLSGLNGLAPDQQISNLATQGVYGQGLGPQEQSYFTNLVNNQLVDKSGNVSDISNVSPIENSYLSQLGLGGFSNSKDLLGAISKWQSGQAA